MKKCKFVVGICLAVQSVTFFILFLVFLGKKKSLARAFGALSVAGGISGAYLLLSEMKVRKGNLPDECCCDGCCDDDDFDAFDTDDIACSFENDDLFDDVDSVEDAVEEKLDD